MSSTGWISITEYEVKLKRPDADVIKFTVIDRKVMFGDSADFFDAARTFSAIESIVDMMKKEGLDWIRVAEK